MLHLATAAGLIAGLLLGLLAGLTGSSVLLALAEGVRPIGAVFLNAVRMVVIPLVAAAVFLGVAKLGDPRKLSRLGGLALGFFWTTTLAAILAGMGAMRLAVALSAPVQVPPVGGQAAPELPSVLDFLVGLVPSNPFAAASQGALLPLIVFSILFAAAAGTLSEVQRAPLIALAESVAAALIRLVHWILWTAPVGVFALAAPITAESGWAMLQRLAVFVTAVIVGLVVFVALVYLPAVWLLGRCHPLRFLRGSIGPFMIGFTTTSSLASLPVMLDAADGQLHVSPTVSNLVLPLAASLNRAGSALFQGAAIVFLASVYSVPIPAAGLGAAVLATFLVSITVAPVPSASVVTLAPALDAVGIPLGGLAILLGVDRIPDMFRTATNVTGGMAAAVVVEGLREPSSR